MPRKNKPKPKPQKKRETAFAKQQRRASAAGFHFHNLYQCCQIKWAIKFLLRIKPTHTAMPLINGSAFHEGKGTFYQTGSAKKAILRCKQEITSRKSEFQYLEDYEQTLERCPILLEAWIAKFGYGDLKRFNFIAVEEELQVPVPGTDFILTVRPDAVVEDSTGCYILETKTSSFSIKTTELGVYNGDQATAYIWAVKQAYGKHAEVIPDIAYWNKIAKDASNISCVRGDIVSRNERDMAQYIGGLAQLQTEISQKVNAFKNGYDFYTLFQRNTYYCNAFFKPCEFADVCRNDLTTTKRLPPGLKRSRTRVKPALNHYVNDTCQGAT